MWRKHYNTVRPHSAINTIGYTATTGIVKPAAGVGLPIASDGYPFGSSARRCQIAFRLEF
jgi:hypothetical protein